MSLRAIADRAGVSVSTVSRVVNDRHPEKVSEETRRRILDIARSMRYRPNPEAVALKTRRRTTTLGMLIPYHSHIFRGYYWSEISCGVLDAARKRGVDVNMMVYYEETPETFRKLLSTHRNVAGVIVLGVYPAENPAIEQCRAAMLPFVVVNNNGAVCDASSVDSDNLEGARGAVLHLVGLGHRRIALIAGKDFPDARQRRLGYEAALCESGIALEPELVVSGDFEESGGRQAMRSLLALDPRPTAVFAANDDSAIGAMTVIKAAGLRIPEDIAVVGFDDVPYSQHVVPALTTVHQPSYRLGARAAEALIDRILEEAGAEAPESFPVIRHVLRTRLVVRDSCGGRRLRREVL